MLAKTIGQLDTQVSPSSADYIEVEHSGASGKISLDMLSSLMHVVGEVIQMYFKKAVSTTFPAIPLDTQADINVANYPLLVPELRAVKAEVNGTTDFACTVTTTIATFTTTTAATALLTAMKEDAIVRGWFNGGEIANFLGGTDYSTASTQRTINIAGTDYVYTAINVPAMTVTVTGSPATGSQTAIAYPHRIAGSTTTARIFKTSGFAPVNAGDAGNEIIGGYCKMDRGQGHRHLPIGSNFLGGTGAIYYGGTGGNMTGLATTGVPTTDTINGTPRTGKTNDPRTQSLHFYLWAGQYLP